MWSGKCLVWWMLCNPLIYKLSCWRSCSQLANLCFWHNNLLAQLKPFTNLSPFINNCHPTRPMFNDFCKNIGYAPVAVSGELHKCGWIIWHQLECWPSTDQPGEKPPTINLSHCFQMVSSKWRLAICLPATATAITRKSESTNYYPAKQPTRDSTHRFQNVIFRAAAAPAESNRCWTSSDIWDSLSPAGAQQIVWMSGLPETQFCTNYY